MVNGTLSAFLKGKHVTVVNSMKSSFKAGKVSKEACQQKANYRVPVSRGRIPQDSKLHTSEIP